MPIGQVIEKSYSSGGKLKLRIQTSEGPPKWYFANQGTDPDEVIGKRIDFTPGQFSFVDKKTGKTIWMDTVKEWALAQSQSAPAAPQPVGALLPTGSPKGAPSTSHEPQQRALSTLFDHELRFISNVVGQAIYAGSCKTPDEIYDWFQAAQSALAQTGFTSDGAVKARIEDALSPKDRGNQTKSANEQVSRILEAIRKGQDSAALSIWLECSYLKTSTEFEASVYAALPTTVQNRLKDLADMEAASRGAGYDSEVGF